jgi:CheY-like chemotaxis protein
MPSIDFQPQLRVLLADTELDFFARVTLLLEEAAPRRHDVRWACCYAFAVGDLRRQPYDLCLVSAQIGHRSGQELLAHIRTRHPRLPAILLAAGAEPGEFAGHSSVDCLDRDRLTPEMLHRAIRDAVFQTAGRATLSAGGPAARFARAAA